jgi:hypothetical protein
VRQRSARPSAKHIETRGSWGRAGPGRSCVRSRVCSTS